MSKFNQIFFLLFIISLTCCSSGPETYTVEIIDGVRHVHNLAPLWGEEQKIELEFVRKIGDLETEDENYQLYRPRDAILDHEENIIIIDAGNYSIKKFDRTGKFILAFGNKGQGPGEFDFPFKVSVDSNNNIYIFDSPKNYVHVFSSHGDFLKGIRYDKEHYFPFDMLRNGNIIMVNKDIDESRLVFLMNSDSEIISDFGSKRQYKSNRLNYRGNLISFTEGLSGRLVLAFHNQNRIDVHDSERNLLYKISRELPYVEDEDYRSSNPGKPNETLWTNCFSACVAEDGKNRIWISTVVDQENRGDPGSLMFEIYDEDGTLLTRFENDLLALRTIFKIYDDKMFIVDTFEEHCVYEYRIVDKQ